MSAFFGLIGFFALIVGLVMVVIALIRRKPKKTAGIIAGLGFALFIVGLALPSPSDTVDKEKEIKPDEKVAAVKETEKDTEKDAKVKKEEEKKAKEREKVEKEKAEKERKANEEKEKEEKKKRSVNVDFLKNALPIFTEDALTLQEASYNYILENSELFPAINNDALSKVKEQTDSTINIKHLNKNIVPYLEKIVTAQGSVVKVEETQIEDGRTISYLHLLDDDFNSYMILYLNDSGDILEDDTVQFWGAPVGPYSFENISGGFTNSQMFFGSHIEKK